MVREKTERLEMRVSTSFLATVDEWRRKQPDLPPRAEAIRRLVEKALATGAGKETAEDGIDQALAAEKSGGPRIAIKPKPARRR